MEEVTGSIPVLPTKIKEKEELAMGRLAIRKEAMTSWGIPQKYADRVKGAEIISPAGSPTKVIEEKAPSVCPHCGAKMSYEHMGCDGDYCWGFFFCPDPAHQGEVYPTASGPH